MGKGEWKSREIGVLSGRAKQKLDITLQNTRGPEGDTQENKPLGSHCAQGQQPWQDSDSRKWENQDPAGESADESCLQLELTANWQGCLPLSLHVHLERWESVQDCFWWAQWQTMAGGPLRQVRSAAKLCSKLREGRKRGCNGGTQRLMSWERSWGLREPGLLVRAKS